MISLNDIRNRINMKRKLSPNTYTSTFKRHNRNNRNNRNLDCIARNTRSYHPKLNAGLSNKVIRNPPMWVSATHLRNYMLRDPIVDWLKTVNRVERKGNGSMRCDRKSNNDDYFSSFIKQKGNEFEEKVLEHLKTKTNIVTVSNVITPESVNRTKELMMKGTPVIHSAPVENNKTHTRGIIDLLVRSDYIHRLVDNCPLPIRDKCIAAPKLKGKYHYLVIDIKFSTLPLTSDGIHILNTNKMRFYKAQVWVYTQAIGLIQGYTARYGFLLGRRWRYKSREILYHCDCCDDKMGMIDYLSWDSDYKSLSRDATKWIRDVRRDGMNWTVDPPCRPELYPNMCVDSGIWNAEKERIAARIGEITSVWYCGIKHREKAFKNDIKSWRDPRCTSKNIGVSGMRSTTIDKILAINRQNDDVIWPKKINNKIFNWRSRGDEVYVDFETLIDIFSDMNDIPYQRPTDQIFLIGVYYNLGNRWHYKKWVCKEPTLEEEFRIMNEFEQFMNDLDYPRMFFYSAEEKIWNRAEKRQFDRVSEIADPIVREELKDHISDNWNITRWCDMYDLFITTPIVIKDCFKFSLKHIGKAMAKHNLIKTVLTSDCSSGMYATVKAWNCYQNNDNPENSIVMRDIIKYNKYDVKVLRDIMEYLRNNH